MKTTNDDANTIQIGQRTITLLCTVPGCGRKHLAHGLCSKHYARVRRTGTTERTTLEQGQVCSVEGCDRTPRTRGLCHMHYQRWRDHGEVGMSQPVPGSSPLERARARHIDYRADGHWMWTGSTIEGLPTIRDGGTRLSVRRLIAAEALGHEVPRSRSVRVTCGQRLCVNPEHLTIPTKVPATIPTKGDA